MKCRSISIDEYFEGTCHGGRRHEMGAIGMLSNPCQIPYKYTCTLGCEPEIELDMTYCCPIDSEGGYFIST